MKNSLYQDKLDLNPKKFLMWLFIITSFILFAALTSGFIVYTAGDPSRGIKMKLPDIFMYSTAVIIISSITMHLAQTSARALNFSRQKLFLVLTVLLGLAFVALQIQSWTGFVQNRVFFINPNASQSFLYVFIGAHLLHVFAGLILVLYALTGLIKNIPQVRNIFRMEQATIFWHFLDILWIYLYVFLLLNQ